MEFLIRIFFRALHYLIRVLLSILCGQKPSYLPKLEDDILKHSATEIARKIRQKEVKSEDVVKAFIKRIRSVNPVINAVVEDRFLSALDEATEVDRLLRTTNKTEEQLAAQTPFLGVPFTTKNSVAIKGLLIDTGVVFRKGRRAETDSAVVGRLREAGAIPLCITNVPELLMWMDAANNIYGRTKNPYDLNRVPGGSSGGEAALIASGGSVIGVGSDLAGSIRSPAFCCGIFGHKPTPMQVPLDGQFPPSHDNDFKLYNSIGPLCRYAEDLLPTLQVMARGSNLNLHQKVDISKIRLFYTESYIKSPYTTPMNLDMANAVLRVVSKLGNIHNLHVKQIELPNSFNKAFPIWFSKISTANGPSFNDSLTDGQYTINPYWELVKWFFRLSNHTLHLIFFLLAFKWHSALEPKEVTKNVRVLEETRQILVSMLGENGVLIYPPKPEPAIFHQEQIFKMSNWGYMAIFNALGFPVTLCPVGLNANGLPLGVQVVAAPNNDRLCLAVALEIEKAFGGWKEPPCN